MTIIPSSPTSKYAATDKGHDIQPPTLNELEQQAKQYRQQTNQFRHSTSMAADILAHASYYSGHALVLGLLAFIAYISPPFMGDKPIFSLHPFFTTLGFIGLVTEAILVFHPAQAKFCNESKVLKTRLHLWIQIAASVSLAIGFAGIYIHREQNNKQHFKPWHGLIGLIALIAMWSQTAFSLILLLPGRYFASTALPLHRLKTLHTIMGIISYFTMATCFVLGFTTKFFGRKTEGNDFGYYMCWIASIVLFVIVLVQSCGSVFKRLRHWSSSGTAKNRRGVASENMNEGLLMTGR